MLWKNRKIIQYANSVAWESSSVAFVLSFGSRRLKLLYSAVSQTSFPFAFISQKKFLKLPTQIYNWNWFADLFRSIENRRMSRENLQCEVITMSLSRTRCHLVCWPRILRIYFLWSLIIAVRGSRRANEMMGNGFDFICGKYLNYCNKRFLKCIKIRKKKYVFNICQSDLILQVQTLLCKKNQKTSPHLFLILMIQNMKLGK